MTDAIDTAIAATPKTIAAKQVTFHIKNNAGQVKPVMLSLPADLTHEEALAVVGACATICQQVIDQQKPASPLTLVRGTLPT